MDAARKKNRPNQSPSDGKGKKRISLAEYSVCVRAKQRKRECESVVKILRRVSNKTKIEEIHSPHDRIVCASSIVWPVVVMLAFPYFFLLSFGFIFLCVFFFYFRLLRKYSVSLTVWHINLYTRTMCAKDTI